MVKSGNGNPSDFKKLQRCRGWIDKQGNYEMKYLDNGIENPFILIIGSSTPPSSVSISGRDDNYENGIRMDLENMINYVNNETICELMDIVRGGSKQTVLDSIKKVALKKYNDNYHGGSVHIYVNISEPYCHWDNTGLI